jgi:rhamnose utilization protein RhaD (predicted bifunctional aldolase and dehydrogenase)
MLIDSSALIKISKEIGNKIDYVQGGGGNTSYKIDNETMLIKASGTLLKEMNEKVGYVALKYDEILSEINKIEIKTQESEEKINKVIMDKRIQLDKVKLLRPSIETGFHMLLDKAVIHSHSVYSNIYNCSQEGKSLLKNLLKEEDYVFIPYDSPGLGLTLLIKKIIDNHKGIFKVVPKYLFLENHGIIVNAKDENTAIEYHREINMTLRKSLKNLGAYPKLTVNKDLLSKNKYVFDVLKGSSFNFENVLFPDQVVYFKENISYNIDPLKKNKHLI